LGLGLGLGLWLPSVIFRLTCIPFFTTVMTCPRRSLSSCAKHGSLQGHGMEDLCKSSPFTIHGSPASWLLRHSRWPQFLLVGRSLTWKRGPERKRLAGMWGRGPTCTCTVNHPPSNKKSLVLSLFTSINMASKSRRCWNSKRCSLFLSRHDLSLFEWCLIALRIARDNLRSPSICARR